MLIDELIKDLKERFNKIIDHRSAVNTQISLTNVLLNGLALFSLKDSSLNIYREQFKIRKENLKKVFGIKNCPSDTALRQILDEVAPESLKVLPVQYIDLLLKEKHITRFELKGKDLTGKMYIPLDGTTYFNSKKVHGDCCQTKKHKDGTISYSHSALVATRLLPLVKQALGSQKAIIVGDGLFANAPFIRTVTGFGFNYLLTIKEGNQGYPFVQFRKASEKLFKIKK